MKDIKYYERLWFFNLILVLVCISVFYKIPYVYVDNILSFQFSSDYIKFEKLASLKSHETLKYNNYFDFFFIIYYTLFFIVTLKLVVKALEIEYIKKITFLGIIPGSIDVLENIVFLGLLQKQAQYFEIYYWLVRIKWSILIVYTELMLAILLFYIILSIYRFVYYVAFNNKEKK